MEPLFEAPIFKGFPLVYGVITAEEQLKNYLPSNPARLTQTHSDQFLEVIAPGLYEGYDAFLTQQTTLPLLTRHADCQTLVLYDKRLHLLANIHAGWRGLKASLYTKVIRHLVEEKGSSPKDFLVAIGPSLGPEKAEYVDGEELFPARFQKHHNNRFYDLKAIAKEELLAAGVSEQNIEISPLCTASDNRFHSWRRDKTEKRNVTFCYLLPPHC